MGAATQQTVRNSIGDPRQYSARHSQRLMCEPSGGEQPGTIIRSRAESTGAGSVYQAKLFLRSTCSTESSSL